MLEEILGDWIFSCSQLYSFICIYTKHSLNMQTENQNAEDDLSSSVQHFPELFSNLAVHQRMNSRGLSDPLTPQSNDNTTNVIDLKGGEDPCGSFSSAPPSGHSISFNLLSLFMLLKKGNIFIEIITFSATLRTDFICSTSLFIWLWGNQHHQYVCPNTCLIWVKCPEELPAELFDF